MGLLIARYVVLVEPIATMTPVELAAMVGPVVERYLVGDLGSAREARDPDDSRDSDVPGSPEPAAAPAVR